MPTDEAGLPAESPAALFTLRELRRLVVGPRRRLFAAGVAALVGFFALLVGGMLTLEPVQGAYISEVIWWGAPSAWWFYPEVLVVQPWGILQLPLLPTVAMVLVALASGLAATAGLVLVGDLLKRRVASGGRPATWAGAGTGAGPGLASVATLGACCCTSCASTGGLALVAAASGTTSGTLLGIDWYLPIFQLAVVYVLLVAQERALRAARRSGTVAPPLGLRFAASSALRLLLLVGGLTWSIAMFVEWGTAGPGAAGAATWYHWIVEHQLLALAAVAAALFPSELGALAARGGRAVLGVRALLFVGAVTWGIGVPPGLPGLGGLVNELLGALGVPAALGGIPPDGPLGAALLFHWAVQHLLIAGFALALAVRPAYALAPLLWSVARPAPAAPAGSAGAAEVGGAAPAISSEPAAEASG